MELVEERLGKIVQNTKPKYSFLLTLSGKGSKLEYYESTLLLLEHYQYMDSIYLDYSKAFGKCDHDIILKTLDSLGIQGKLNEWI